MKAVIMAGGQGSRIRPIAPDIPKPMIDVAGRPVLERAIEQLRDQGFWDITITVSHLKEAIISYFGDGSGISPATGKHFGVDIRYYVETQPLGSGGALFKLRDSLTEDFLLLNADAVFSVDLRRFTAFHEQKGDLITLFTHPNSHPYDSGLIVADRDGAVRQWLSREDARPEFYRNCVNAGLHVISPRIFDLLNIEEGLIGAAGPDGRIIKIDLDRQVLKPFAGSGKMYAYQSPEYIKDLGTPERYRAVCDDLRRGLAEARALRNRQKAIFLDRDGTINRYAGFLRDINVFELLPKAADAIREINRSGYLAIAVTNQPVIARGELTEAQLEEIHNKMETLLGREGAYLDAVYYCPHHPHSGFAGEIRSLKIDCGCRKPKPGMLLKAAEDFNIDPGKSWMIGDGGRDMAAGKGAGCRTVLLGEGDYGQDLVAGTLFEAVQAIMGMEGDGKFDQES